MPKREPGISPYNRDGKQVVDKFKKPVWQLKFTLGIDDDNRPVIHRELFHGSYKDAVERKKSLCRDFSAGIDVEKANRETFADYTDAWLKCHESQVTPETYAKDKRMARYICDSLGLGSKPISKIRKSHIEDALQQLREQGARRKLKDGTLSKPRRLTEKTLYKYRLIMHAVMDTALMDDAVAYNCVDRVKLGKAEKSDRRATTAAETAKLRAELEKYETEQYGLFYEKEQRLVDGNHDPGTRRKRILGIKEIAYSIGIRIAMATGMRQGEILALTWASIDLLDATVKISKSRASSGRIKDPKSDNGTRVVPIDADTVKHLYSWKNFQLSVLTKFGCIGSSSDFNQDDLHVVCNNSFNGANNSDFGHWWSAWREAHGFTGIRMHEIRHGYATQLLEAGLPPAIVAKNVGDELSTVLAFYYNALPGVDRRVSDIIGGIASGATIEQVTVSAI